MNAASTFEALVARGCLCGTDRVADCPLHTGGDNRGIGAFFKAGMPRAFPTAASCWICGAEGLLYPNVQIDDGTDGFKPTLVCPQCSTASCERALVAEVEAAGRHRLNPCRVFSAQAMICELDDFKRACPKCGLSSPCHNYGPGCP